MSDDRSPIGIVNQEAADRRRQRRKGHIQIIEEDRKRLREENARLTDELAEAREEWERFALAVGLADGDQGRYVYATVDEAINEIKRAQSEHLADIDELAAVKEESAETCRKLLEDNHRIEVQLAEARGHIEWLNAWLLKHHGTCDPDALRAWGQIRAAIDAGKNDAGTSVRPADLGE